MILNSLQISNFKTYRKQTDFSFRRGEGLHFLTGQNVIEPGLGENGVGKSSLFDALVWVLYGKTAQGVKAANVRSWNSTKPCKARLEFDIGSTTYVIERTWGPISLKLDGEDVDQSAIDTLLNLTPEEFNYSIFASQFGQRFFDLTPTEKLTVFTDIMVLESWATRSTKASTAAKAIEVQKGEIQRAFDATTGALAGLTSEMERNRSASQSYEKEKAGQLKELRDTHNEWCDEYDNLVETFEALQKQKLTEPSIEIISTRKTEAEKKAEKLDEIMDEISECRFKIKALKKEHDKFDDVLAECPYCNQHVSEEYLKEEKFTLTGKIVREEKTKSKAEKAQRKLHEKYTVLLDKIDEASHEHNQYVLKKQEHKQSIAAMEAQLRTLEESIERQDELIDMTETKVNPFTKLLVTSKTHKMRLAKELKSYQGNIDQLMRKLEGLQFWVKGFKEIRLFLVEEALTQLEVEINNNLLQLGLRDWSIKLDVERETAAGGVAKGFHVAVQSPYNPKPVPWAVWSGGESQRLRLAGTMGLADLILARKGIDCNIEIYDEPTAHLSPPGVEDLLDSLYHRAIDRKKQIWLVDHCSLDSGNFASTTTVVKDKEGSHIVVA